MMSNRVLIAICLVVSFSMENVYASEPETATEPKAREYVSKEIQGWTVQVNSHLLEGQDKELGRQTLEILTAKLTEIVYIVPEDRLSDLRKVTIWVDHDHPLRSLQYHPSPGWLENHGYERRLAKGVHIPQAVRFVRLQRTNHQPAVIIHELAHAYHDQVLGFDHDRIREAYSVAKNEELYDSVRHIRGRDQKHYALTDHKEFFAEMTECYFSTNDFYPFVRAELRDYDPRTFELLKEIWGPVP